MNELEMPDWLNQRVALSPDAPALFFNEPGGPTSEWTFATLQRDALELASRLQNFIVKGRPVALLLGNGPSFVLAIHALIQLNAVTVPLNIRLTVPELLWQLNDVGAGLLISESRFTTQLAQFGQQRPDMRILEIDKLLVVAGSDLDLSQLTPDLVEPRQHLNLDALHTIIYSSGTTGRPKGIMLTYSNHWWSVIGSSLNLGLYPSDKWLAVLPLFHVGGLSLLFKSVIYGIPLVLHSSFQEAAVNHAIDYEGVTIASVVSTMLVRMLDERHDKPYPPTLRCLLLGGGPAPQPLLERCAAIGAPVVQSYGLTETASQNTTLAPADALTRLGSAGKPLFPNLLMIDAPDTEGIGEILVRGPTVTTGYWQRPDETAIAVRNGWLHTGDLGRLDSAGFLYVLDRRSDLIISGGENVYPAEVEAILLSHPAIAEAGVFGLTDQSWGQIVTAAVRLRPGQSVTPTDLTAFLSTKLARFKIPVKIFFVTPDQNLPRNAAGKLLRRELREQYK